jgi:hypothetical protein
VNAIAIGKFAGQTGQTAGSIVICATGTAINGAAAATYLSPLRALAAATAVYYNTTTFELSYLTSSEKTKNTIEDLSANTSVVYNLEPKSYIYNSDPCSGAQVGYIAEQVEKLHKNFATYNECDGPPVAINYDTIIVFLVEELKKLKQRLDLLSPP